MNEEKEKSIEKIKAEEILLSYKCYLLYDIYNKEGATRQVDINTSKNNAIRAVDLILESQKQLLDYTDVFALDTMRKYWKEVRSCIAESELFNKENN